MAVAASNLRMSPGVGPSVHPFFTAKPSSTNSITTRTDIDGNRKKRQRTSSPGRGVPSTEPLTNTWQDQLKAAAEGGSAVSQIASSSAASKTIVTEQSDAEDHDKAAVDKDLQAEETPEKQGSATLLKKMLKVRPDGKLVSPKTKRPVNKGHDEVKKTSPTSKSTLKQKIVVFKYGVDNETRISMAQKIQDIWTEVKLNPSIEAHTHATARKTNEPAKATHPFFLGALPWASDPQIPPSGINHGESVLDTTKHTRQATSLTPSKANLQKTVVTSSTGWGVTGELGGKPLNLAKSRTSRFPDAVEPIWPPQGMAHIGRPLEAVSRSASAQNGYRLYQSGQKLKDTAVQIPEHLEILRPYADLSRAHRTKKDLLQDPEHQDTSLLRQPQRRVMTGRELQQAVRQNIACKLPLPDKDKTTTIDGKYPLDIVESCPVQVHNAVLHVYEEIATSLTAFDKFECETRDWVHKYAPSCAEQTLQQGREVVLLRDWLRCLTISSVEGQSASAVYSKDSKSTFKKTVVRSKKRRQKKAEELDGFIISSDEEANQMDEITEPGDNDTSSYEHSPLKRSVIQTGVSSAGLKNCGDRARAANAVVISGPHGCGKTAAVYGVAQELGFEVFEINAGSRRSGKDLMDKVGDMTRNHLVNRGPESDGLGGHGDNEDLSRVTDSLKLELESGRQGTMNSFFQRKELVKKNSKGRPRKKEMLPKSEDEAKKSRSQKQSVILLEEVDVLFEEDRQFWATAIELILQSKRPVIMTCTDESLLLLDDIPLYAIFRFQPPPEQLATDYLLLLACNEGHLVAREVISALYRSTGHDLRASITELNFFCQMAIGDSKGGLEWMLIRSSPKGCQNAKGELLRVVSEGTYFEGMGRVRVDLQNLSASSVNEDTLMSKALNSCDVRAKDSDDACSAKAVIIVSEELPSDLLRKLRAFEEGCDALSAADIYPRFGLQNDNTALLNTTEPEPTEKSRMNFVEGATLLQADPLDDHAGISTALTRALKVCAMNGRAQSDNKAVFASLTEDFAMHRNTPESQRLELRQQLITRSAVSTAFGPIAWSPKSLSKGPMMSSFDSPLSVIVEDLAPYVRSIVSYDLKLEGQRLELNSLLSSGVRKGKRIRTTRASRAALEGGHKADTRRERWFPGNTNFALILRSGGSSWQSIAWQRARRPIFNEDTSENTSRRGSVASTLESEVS